MTYSFSCFVSLLTRNFGARGVWEPQEPVSEGFEPIGLVLAQDVEVDGRGHLKRDVVA